MIQRWLKRRELEKWIVYIQDRWLKKRKIKEKPAPIIVQHESNDTITDEEASIGECYISLKSTKTMENPMTLSLDSIVTDQIEPSVYVVNDSTLAPTTKK